MKKQPYSRRTLEDFLNDLSSERGAPGGGAAAALAGALGVSLLEMTVRINARRAKGAGKKGLEHKVKWLSGARRSLLSLMAKDAEVFEKIAELYRKKEKGPAWQGALKKGAVVPYQIAEIVSGAGDILPDEASRTSAWLFSDLKESALLLSAAFDSAALNVEVNLKEIRDNRLVRGMRKNLTEMRSSLDRDRKSLSRKRP